MMKGTKKERSFKVEGRIVNPRFAAEHPGLHSARRTTLSVIHSSTCAVCDTQSSVAFYSQVSSRGYNSHTVLEDRALSNTHTVHKSHLKGIYTVLSQD